MNRRRFLTVAPLSLILVSLAGCIRWIRGKPPKDEVVTFASLSPEAKQEFERALQEDGFHTCNDLALIEVDKPDIKYNGDFYTVTIEHGDTGNQQCDGYFVEVHKADI